MKPLYTASSLERVFECPTSVHLPQVWASSSHAARGTSIHGFSQSVLSGMSMADALAQVEPQWRKTCEAIDFSKLGGDLRNVRAESAYAWNVVERKAHFLGLNIGREYDVGETEIPGSSDIEGVRMDDVPVVCDIKTGQPVTATEHNTQLLYHAMVLHELTGADEVQGRIIYIAEDGSAKIDQHTWGAFELDDFGDEMEDAFGAVIEAGLQVQEKGWAPVNRGEWCAFCPAMQACPAWTGMARRMVTDLEDVQLKLEALAPDEQARAWTMAKQAETLVEVILKGLKGIAKQTPIILEDGSVVRPMIYKRDDFDKIAAIKLLRDKGVTSAEIQTLYRAHTVEQVRRFAAPKTRKTSKPRAKKLPAGEMSTVIDAEAGFPPMLDDDFNEDGAAA